MIFSFLAGLKPAAAPDKSARPGVPWGLLAGYLLLALLLTWPTVARLTSHVPGDGGDDPAIAWNLWWLKYALLDLGQNPLQTDYMFYPIGINLAFYTLTVLNGLLALPVTLNLGVVAASNLHLFFTFVAGGYGTFLLTRYLLAGSRLAAAGSARWRWWVAAGAGGFYAFASSKLFYAALGQFNIASHHWVPFALLYLVRSGRQPNRLKNTALAALFFTLQAWSEMTYASFILVFVGLYWGYHLLLQMGGRALRRSGPAQRAPVWPHLRAAGLLGLGCGLGLSPLLAQMLPDMLREGDFLVEGGGFADVFSADLLGFVIPTMHHPWLGGLISQTGLGQPGSVTGFDKGQHIYLGLTLLGLLLLALPLSRQVGRLRFWLMAAAAFGLLTLGPEIILNGQPTGLPGPFGLLQQLPFFKGNRYPSRYSVMLLLSLSVTAAFSLAWLGARLKPGRRYALLALVAGLFLLEHLSLPLPQSDLRVPAPYHQIAADPGDFAVLDIPFAWRNGFRITGALTTQFMFGQFYQTAHQKKLLQGNTSRNPRFKFQYFARAPLINSLLALETGKSVPAERQAQDRLIAAEVFRFFNIRYLVIRPDSSGSPLVTPQATLPYLESLLPLEPIHRSPQISVYRIPAPPPPPETQLIEPANPLAPLYFGQGWGALTPGQPASAQRSQTELRLPLRTAPYAITLKLRLPPGAEAAGRQVWLTLNGHPAPPSL